MARYASRGLHRRLVEELGAAIVGGQIVPGERVDVDLLEERHGVSRTVVREAIRVLATKGLVDARPKRGTYVLERDRWNMLDADVIGWRYGAELDTQFLGNLHEVRQIIEPAVARIAATRRTDEDLDRLRQALDDMAMATSDVEAAVDADVRFHHTLITATHNEMLEQLEIIIAVGLRTRDLVAMGAGIDAATDVPRHKAIVDAVARGDPAGADAAMQALLERAAADAAAALDRRQRGSRGKQRARS